MLKRAFSFALLLGVTTNSLAHNVWLEPAHNDHQYVVKFGHEQTESYPEHKLQQVSYLDKRGNLQHVTPTFINGEGYFSAEQADIVFLQFDNGIWSKLPNGRYVEKTKQQEPTALLSVKPVKYGKTILNWTEQVYQSHQQAYELIPLNKPEIGKTLQLLVLQQGKPVAGVKVGEVEQGSFATTNSQGIANIPITTETNRIWASFQQATPEENDYDNISIEYLLTFKAE